MNQGNYRVVRTCRGIGKNVLSLLAATVVWSGCLVDDEPFGPIENPDELSQSEDVAVGSGDQGSMGESLRVIDEQTDIFTTDEERMIRRAAEAGFADDGYIDEEEMAFAAKLPDEELITHGEGFEGLHYDSHQSDETAPLPGTIHFGTIRGALVDDIGNQCLRIKVKGHYGYNRSTWTGYSARAVWTWLRPLRELGGRVTACIQWVNSGQDLEVEIRRGTGRAYYHPGYYVFPFGWRGPHIVMYEGTDGWRTTLHEFGHAFGLDDTYIEGVWTCKPGQPNSVMCNTAEELLADDVRGIRFRYCSSYSTCRNIRFYDLYGSNYGWPLIISHQSTYMNGIITWVSNGQLKGLQPLFANRWKGGGMGVGEGTAVRWTCPAGTYITGARMNYGSRVYGIRMLCSNGRYGPWFGDGSRESTGGRIRTFYCPSTLPYAKGIRGYRSGLGISSFGLVCGSRNYWF